MTGDKSGRYGGKARGGCIAALVVFVPDSRQEDFATALENAPAAENPAEVLAAEAERGGEGSDPVGPQIDRVLLVGDSVMAQAYERFQLAFDQRGITTGYAGGPASGPLFPQGDWLAQLDEWLTEFAPDVVVFEACCNYTNPPDELYVDAKGTSVLPNSDAAYEAWDLESRQLIERAAASGAIVLWALPPPVQTNGFYGPMEQHVVRLTVLYEDYEDELPVELLDWRTPLTIDGEYTDDIIGEDGAEVRVRLADGVHMTDAGGDLLAEVTLAHIASLVAG